jgi:hypothetical protein
VDDNTAALRHLRRPQVLTVKFEEFSNASTIVDVVRRVAGFVGIPASTAQLLLALQPPTALLGGKQQCLSYASEAHKEADLAASALQLLAGELGPLAGARAAAIAGDDDDGESDGDGEGNEGSSGDGSESGDSSKSADGDGSGGSGDAGGGGSDGGGRYKGEEPQRTDHNTFRAWQASQAWAPHGSTWRTTLSKEQQAAFAANGAAKKLLRRFGYETA